LIQILETSFESRGRFKYGLSINTIQQRAGVSRVKK